MSEEIGGDDFIVINHTEQDDGAYRFDVKLENGFSDWDFAGTRRVL